LDINGRRRKTASIHQGGILLTTDVPAPEGAHQVRIVVLDSRSKLMESLTVLVLYVLPRSS
jgi:hypothetical protein